MTGENPQGMIYETTPENGEAPIFLAIHNEVFEPGRLSTTEGIDNLLAQDQDFRAFVYDALNRHCSGNWGNISEADREANAQALKEGGRLMSAYSFPPLPKIWIITEADRSRTTVLLPDEYRGGQRHGAEGIRDARGM